MKAKKAKVSFRQKAAPIRYVWCAEDSDYVTQAIFATKKAAERVYGNPDAWSTGYGGIIIKRKVAA
jgi:hypothetical protein